MTDVRTWGPFSGRQLTAVVLAGVAALALPGAAYAVDSFTNVAVMDPVTGAKAKVAGNGQVQVGGSVVAPESLPSALRRSAAFVSSTCTLVAAPSSGRGLVVQGLNVDAYALTSETSHFAGLYLSPTSSPCGGSFLAYVDVTSPGVTSLDLGAGLAVPAGRALYATAYGMAAAVSTFGYDVPGSAIPATAPSAPEVSAPPRP